MKLREILKSVFLIALLFIITSCKEPNIADIKLSDYDIKQDIDDFNINDLTLEVIFDDNTIDIVKVTEDMLSKEDLDKLNNIGIHEINIKYLDRVIPLHINLTDYYNVTYIVDGEIVETQVVEHGKDALFPDESLTNKEGYTFIGWNHDGKNITKDTTIEGTYEINKYEVKFIYAGEVIETQIVEHGKDASLPSEVVKEGHIFINWNHDGKNITKDTVIEVIYELEKYEVRFRYDTELYATQMVEYGSYANPPEPPIKEWEYIMYWSEQLYEPITKSIDINAVVDYIEGGRLLEYKYKNKIEINEYLKVSKEILTEDEKNLIDFYISDGCEQIDKAIDKTEVDKIEKHTKQLIEHIEYKYYIDTHERMIGEEKFTEGNGTYENPYIIDTKGKLIYFSNNTNNGLGQLSCYELRNDINLEGIEWTPIDFFRGYFNGNGYEISNYRITKNYKYSDFGLFSCNTGIIENLGIKNFYIDLEIEREDIRDNINCGGIVGYNSSSSLTYKEEGAILNCYSFGSIKVVYHGEENDCVAQFDVMAGGIVGFTLEGTLMQNYSQVNVDVKYYNEKGRVYISAISGYSSYSSDVQNCFGILSYIKIDNIFNFPREKKGSRSYHTGSNTFDYSENKKLSDECTSEDLNSLEFYTNILGWSEEIWDLSNVVFKDGKFLEDCYPKFKRNKNA